MSNHPSSSTDSQFWWRLLVAIFTGLVFAGAVAWVTNFVGFRHVLGG